MARPSLGDIMVPVDYSRKHRSRRSPLSSWLLSFLVFLSVPITLAQKTDRRSDFPDFKVLSPAFERIWILTLEGQPFQSIKAEFDSTVNGWQVTHSLPSASRCLLRDEIQGRRLAGTNLRLPVYECSFAVDPADSEETFDKLLRQILVFDRHFRTMPDLIQPVPTLRSFDSFHEHLSKSVTFVSEQDDLTGKKYRPTMCYQPRHLSVSWTKVGRAKPTTFIGIQIYPPSTSANQIADCPVVY
jgi:hypothetical protein